MNGILIVDKPEGWTSFDVVAKLRRPLGTKKIGHSGTLDPMATGVLPIFAGTASRAVDMQENHDKTYIADVLFGQSTDTGDRTGTVLERKDVHVEKDDLAKVLPVFEGESMQLPPMYSAVKINGQPLYKAARRGEVVERKARPIVIYSLKLLQQLGENAFRLEIRCGKGTYVRVLLEDIGKALGAPAVMTDLRRTAAGCFTLQHSVTLEMVLRAAEEGTLQNLMLPVETVFEYLPRAEINDATEKRLLNGAPTYKFYKNDGMYRLYSSEGFWGIGRVEEHTLRVEKCFIERG